jgi:hypothetical protein
VEEILQLKFFLTFKLASSYVDILTGTSKKGLRMLPTQQQCSNKSTTGLSQEESDANRAQLNEKK